MINTVISVLFLIISSSAILNAQPSQGDININAGIGAGFYYTSGSSVSIPPIGASLDYNIDDRFSIGGIATYSSSVFNYQGYGKYNFSYLVIGARGNYHFAVNEKVDPYIGAVIAYNIFGSKWSGVYADPGYNYKANAIIPASIFGGRYLFKENLGAFLELGYPMIRIGVTIKLLNY